LRVILFSKLKLKSIGVVKTSKKKRNKLNNIGPETK